MFQALAVAVGHRLGLAGGDHALGLQLACVQLARARPRADDLVHQRLGRGRLVGLVVAVAAVADQVDDHVALEGLAIVQRDLGAEQHRLRIVAVDVEHRRRDDLGDIRAVARGARVFRVVGGEAHLVVDHDVDGAADRVIARLRHLEQLHHHALAGEGRVAVDQDRHHLGARGVLAARLARAHRTGDYRVDDLQVRGIEAQRQVHRAARRGSRRTRSRGGTSRRPSGPGPPGLPACPRRRRTGCAAACPGC
jgi:hypothetical protein